MKHIAKKNREATVRRWIQAYQQARSLLDQISREAWKRLATVSLLWRSLSARMALE